MNELIELEQVTIDSNAEAMALIDAGLASLVERQLVSASEVADLLLDLRSVLDKA